MNPDKAIIDRAKAWLGSGFDEETRSQVRYMMEKEPEELVESFYRNLEFGTGGLRGIMGVGTNRMNKYTVGMATQGLANYLIKSFPGEDIRMAIAHDSRNNSRFFAQVTANVLSSNGFTVFLFDNLRPTPELSFAVRELKCHSGVVITASHNPKEYNGYKVYWNDGAQLVAPHDKNVITEVLAIKDVYDVKFEGVSEKIIPIGAEIDKAYFKKLHTYSLQDKPGITRNDLSIVFSSLHGTGITLVPEALKMFGFDNVATVPEQDSPDGNFPTVHSPNPEEKAAMAMVMDLARTRQADLILATDPDADRVGAGVKNSKGEYILLNGNQTATLLVYYLLSRWQEKGMFKGNEYIAKTIVTSELLKAIADKFSVETFDVLTGFKFIAQVIRENEGSKLFIGGGEESYGFMIGEFVRDKDAVAACCMIAEAAAWAKSNGKSLYELLLDIYLEFGFYKEDLISVTKKGKAGAEAIDKMMQDFRSNPMPEICGLRLVTVKDYLNCITTDLISGEKTPIDLPKSNVLQFFLEDGSKLTVRPSGTEPKIKFYFGVVGKLGSREEFDSVDAELGQKIECIVSTLGLRD
jgi:phosphoglucomutase